MEIIQELLPGCFLLKPKKLTDHRGYFVKTYHEELYTALGVRLDIREEFYSVSQKGVIRGMHFQNPPHDHEKLVFCTQGAVLDVLLDLRRGDGYGHTASIELSGDNNLILYIPKGIAHGFLALQDDSLMFYKTSTVHAPAFDCGIRWDSFGFDWGIAQPVLSGRDETHPLFNHYNSVF